MVTPVPSWVIEAPRFPVWVPLSQPVKVPSSNPVLGIVAACAGSEMKLPIQTTIDKAAMTCTALANKLFLIFNSPPWGKLILQHE
jgi:hypothetical protein